MKKRKKRRPVSRKTPERVQTISTSSATKVSESQQLLQQLLSELPTDIELIKQTNLGFTHQTCRVCGTTGDFQTWRGIEMMQGTKKEFPYFVCGNCDCLQIESVPDNLGEFYAGEYYSYSRPPMLKPPATGLKDDFILDVGCGAGVWLCEQVAEGYQYLFGCDPFIEEDLYYPNGVQIKKCTIHDMLGQFDLVRMGDSFEHVTDPLETMQSIRRLLKPTGSCELKLPMYPNVAFQVYGPYWYQLDAPRHIFLHSLKSIQYLAEQTGMVLTQVTCDSGPWQFGISRMYQLGYSFTPDSAENTSAWIRRTVTREVFDKMNYAAMLANNAGCGDHFSLTLRRQDAPSIASV